MNLDWSKVVIKLRAIADINEQHAENTQLLGNKLEDMRHYQLAEFFRGVADSIEAGLEPVVQKIAPNIA